MNFFIIKYRYLCYFYTNFIKIYTEEEEEGKPKTYRFTISLSSSWTTLKTSSQREILSKQKIKIKQRKKKNSHPNQHAAYKRDVFHEKGTCYH